ncbi:MAG: cache domain-containing protein [Anaerolineae bacterium]|jgi:putative methionine-R-sulfoxide reductase with GAF domain
MKNQIKKPQATLSLTTTLAIAFFVLGAVVLLISSSLQLFFSVQIQQESIANEQQLIAQDAAKTVSSFIQEKFSVLETTVWLVNPTVVSPEEQKPYVANLLGLQPAFRQLALLDSQGQVLVHISRLSQAMSESFIGRIEPDLLAQIKQENRYISSVYVDEATSEPLIIIAVPMIDALGDFQGTLVAEVNLKFMWDLVDQLKVGETGQAYVVDKKGNLLAFSDTARVLRGENVSHLKEVGEFIGSSAPIDETGTSISSGIEGATIVGTYASLGTPDWAIVTELPVREAYQAVIRGVALSAGVMVVMATLAGLTGAYVARRLSAPLLALTKTASQIAGGEIDLQAKPEGPTEAIDLAQAFNTMTTRLREVIVGLQGRARALETSAEVSRRLSTILDQEHLVTEVVQQMQTAFDYYHVHIYLIDETTQDLVMAGGTGTAGQRMQADGHRIPWGKGLTGRAAATNDVVLVPDVSQEEGWLPNPLLPETKSEVAVPITVGERVLGVLDVQHNVTGGLGETDVGLLQSVAGQVAVALQNARVFAQARERAGQEALVNRIAQQIQRTTTIESTLQAAARELGRALGAQRASVQLEPTVDGDYPRQ